MDNQEVFADSCILCVECGSEFTWSAQDKRFMQECVDNKTPNPINGTIMEKVTPPKRCRECRTKRKAFFTQNKK